MRELSAGRKDVIGNVGELEITIYRSLVDGSINWMFDCFTTLFKRQSGKVASEFTIYRGGADGVKEV